MKILISVLILSAIILFHEFGHFTLARLCGVVVEEFSLGMGPRLLSHVSRKSGTRYSVKIFPFGGSCLMKGEDMEDETEGSFGTKKVWQRFLIVAAGPFFNFILAFTFSLFIIGAVGVDKPVVLQVTEGFPAEKAGILPGDEITSIGGSRIQLYRDVTNYVTFHQQDFARETSIPISWVHEGEKHTAEIIPEKAEDGRYLIGISGSSSYRTRGGFLNTLYYSLVELRYWIGSTIGSLRMLFTGQVSPNEVAGPVGVVQTIGETYEESRSDGAFYVWLNLLQISVLLSANLGVMNLLPLPALDGGRILLFLVEALRRKRLNQNVEGYINLAGFSLLMALMVLIMLNDVRKLF